MIEDMLTYILIGSLIFGLFYFMIRFYLAAPDIKKRLDEERQQKST